jgi:hypothetical protein
MAILNFSCSNMKTILKNGAPFCWFMPCVSMRILDSNPRSDGDLISAVTVQFDKCFGEIMWCVAIQREPNGIEQILITYQRAQKTLKTAQAKQILYSHVGEVDSTAIALAVANAKAGCLIPLEPAREPTPKSRVRSRWKRDETTRHADVLELGKVNFKLKEDSAFAGFIAMLMDM